MASTAPKSKRTIAEDVFGGSDSELSDEEESADEQPQKKPAVASAQSDDGGQDDDDEDEDDEDEERFQSVQGTQKGKENSDEEAYGEEEEDDRRPVKKAKPPKQRKRPAEEDADVDADGDTEMQGEERPKKKKQTKKKQRQASPEVEAEPVELTEQEIRRRRIDEQIDAALRAGKRTKPRKKTGEDDLDIMADEEVSALRHDMMQAALDDERSNQLRQPGTAKLRLLAQVVNTLQKTHLQQSILDNNLLEGVRRWLEPLPDRSLPALNIQRQFFAILDKMQIDTISLKMSGLGKIVLFYSKCDRVVPAIRRSSEKLIETWSRPILKRSASYRDRALQSQDYYGDTSRSGATGGRGGYESTLASSQGLSASQAALARRMVSVPQAVHAGFKVAPRTAPSAGAGDDASHAARLANHQKMNRFKKSMKTKQTR